MIIDGVKMSSKDIEGTDLEAIKIFCQKNKVRAAAMVYVDKNDGIEICWFYFDAKSRNLLDKFFRYLEKYNERH
jgi:hypothetical protein